MGGNDSKLINRIIICNSKKLLLFKKGTNHVKYSTRLFVNIILFISQK